MKSSIIALSYFGIRTASSYPTIISQTIHGGMKIMTMNSLANINDVLGERILWEGPLFGRLPKTGKDYLVKERGWNKLSSSTDDDDQQKSQRRRRRLALIWPNKSGPQFDINDMKAAHIRPFPKKITDIVDDKIHLATTLDGKSFVPKYLKRPPEDVSNNEKLYFVKHRHGVQGKSIYVYNQEELYQWYYLSKSKNNNHEDFLIQEEIPPALHDGRKFVLRSHILIIQRQDRQESYIHSMVICQHHATKYLQNEKSSHISQAGKKGNPLPQLLEDLPPQHPASDIFSSLASCSKELVSTTFPLVFPIERDTTCFALLGVDSMVDTEGKIQICEVNSHPALGWGTMSKVPSYVFASLIRETLQILLDGVKKGSLANFHQL